MSELTQSVSDSIDNETLNIKNVNNDKVLDLIQNQSKIINKRKRFVNPLQLNKNIADK